MEQELGFKELYDVSLKATYPIEVGKQTFEIGETIARFDKIQLANFQEAKKFFSANGGFDNRAHVWWEETKEIKLNFSQGIFSKTQLALMTNAKLLTNEGEQFVSVNKVEQLESNENGQITTQHIPRRSIFLYDAATGQKISDWEQEENVFTINEPYKEVVIDYCYDYDNGCTILSVGQQLTCGYFSLTGKTRVKDDITGQVKTGIINIPKLKLMSDLSMRLGSDATPQTGRLDAVAIPVGGKGQKKVMEIVFLNDDIDADVM